jgi:hypothetical protein
MYIPLVKFAVMMDMKLNRNSHKNEAGGWGGMAAFEILNRIRDELEELEEAIRNPSHSREDIVDEAVDVANFAMMMADVLGVTEADYRKFLERKEACAGVGGAG